MLSKDYKQCIKNLSKDIIIHPALKHPRRWLILMSFSSGPFQGQTLGCTFNLDEYPDKCPLIKFTGDVFHPLVERASGIFDSSGMFPSWNKNIGLYSLINQIYDSFNEPKYVQNPINEEANAQVEMNSFKPSKASNIGLDNIKSFDSSKHRKTIGNNLLAKTLGYLF